MNASVGLKIQTRMLAKQVWDDLWSKERILFCNIHNRSQ